MTREQKCRRTMAKQVRAGIIGLLACCDEDVCAYPLEKHLTTTGHSEDCPAHYMMLSARNVAATSVSPKSEVSIRVHRWLADAPDELAPEAP
jgi:hypothetical protein